MNEKMCDRYHKKEYMNNRDYAAPDELMVWITLAEYRSLVEKSATADQYDALKTEWELKGEINRLKEQIIELTTAANIKEQS